MPRIRPITLAVAGGIVCAAMVVGLIVLSVRSSLEFTCEACMTFRGSTVCREATGRTAEEAARTAKENACALAGATGMTLSIECSNAAPDRLSCRQGAP